MSTYPPVCTCGKQLGGYLPAYFEMKAVLLADAMEKNGDDVDANMLSVSYETMVPMEDLLNSLQANLDCCRLYFVGARPVHLTGIPTKAIESDDYKHQ